ncbi:MULTISPECIES: acyl carrier protein [unclassified Micromonospora]|uniref:acyl carrier protein n=1 Tax=unclassified Micromonospora TaxID=2617518 RepID=UPI00104C25C7|nr:MULTISPECIES: acyl carrier protein [unclassified Micromonospora]TDB80626.1 acyl carrier protein [Micromonospora sp. KC721]TDC42855.1 acyl carrier protein [Micromonospora sp. KC213]
MTDRTVTLDDLRRVLRECAGADEQVDLDGDILDTEFSNLGYDSLAMLETSSRIEQEYGVKLDDDTVISATTPRAFLAVINGA